VSRFDIHHKPFLPLKHGVWNVHSMLNNQYRNIDAWGSAKPLEEINDFALANKIYTQVANDLDLSLGIIRDSSLELMELMDPLSSHLLERISHAVGLLRDVRTELYDVAGYSMDRRFQSGEVDHQQVLTGFSDEMPGEVQKEETYTDPARMIGDESNSSIGSFFARPVNIVNYTWTVGGCLNLAFNPWALFFNNKRVINRIANYSMMRCELHLKFVINGNAFYYGRLAAAYLPLHNYDDYSFTGLPSSGALTELSQRLHCVMNPTTSQGAEMVLPFFWSANSVDVVGSTYQELGEINLYEVNPLLNTASSTEALTVSVFAWAEKVVLSGPTTRNPLSIVPQAGYHDERDPHSGSLSAVATAISKSLRELSAIPSIAPLAMPSSMVMKGVSKLASSFGYSRPNIMQPPNIVRTAPCASLANVDVPDTVQKLTLDPKQELSVDPRISGVGTQDDLAISSMATREAYLTSFAWNSSQAKGTMLYNMRICPTYFSVDGSKIYFTPVAFAAMPFRYWTGSIKVRFEVVASGFHRGRVLVRYDPQEISNDELNLSYADVVDISTDTDIGYKVGISQPINLLPVRVPGAVSLSNIRSTSVALTTDSDYNGVLGVYVQNELVTSNPGLTSITVNVYVSAGEDFEVFVPTSAPSLYSVEPQAGLHPTGEEISTEIVKYRDVYPSTSNHDDLNKIYIGERVLSLRSLLKRYTLHETSGYGAHIAGGIKEFWTVRNAFPYYKGKVAGAVHSTSVLAPYNYCNTLLLHLISLCFSGRRGSIRYKFVPRGGLANVPLTVPGYSVELLGPSTDFSDVATMVTASATPSQHASRSVLDNGDSNVFGPLAGSRGAALSGYDGNPILEFEVPFYSNYRFSPGKNANWTVTPSYVNFGGFQCKYQICTTTSARWAMDHYVAIGEDFQFYFFSGIPALYYTPSPPAPL